MRRTDETNNSSAKKTNQKDTKTYNQKKNNVNNSKNKIRYFKKGNRIYTLKGAH